MCFSIKIRGKWDRRSRNGVKKWEKVCPYVSKQVVQWKEIRVWETQGNRLRTIGTDGLG